MIHHKWDGWNVFYKNNAGHTHGKSQLHTNDASNTANYTKEVQRKLLEKISRNATFEELAPIYRQQSNRELTDDLIRTKIKYARQIMNGTKKSKKWSSSLRRWKKEQRKKEK